MGAITAILTAASLAAHLVLPVPANANMFLQIDGIQGESQDPDHAGEIDVLAWSMSAHHSAGRLPPNDQAAGGRGGGSSVADVQNMSVTKYVDKSSAKIQQACSQGTLFKEAKLTVRKADSSRLEYVTIDFTDLIFTSVQINGPTADEERLTENVTFNFRKVSVEYTPQLPDGTQGETILLDWDASRGSGK